VNEFYQTEIPHIYAAGDVVDYEIVATNGGNVTLTNVQVSDPLLGTLNCSPALGSSSAPGASMTFWITGAP